MNSSSMPSTIALVIAFSLLINEIHIVFDSNVLRNKYFTSNLVCLLSVCLIFREVNLFPSKLRRKYNVLCLLLEVPLSIVLLEAFLFYVWRSIQEYLVLNADRILVHLAEEWGLEWLVCHLCCGHASCCSVFADVALKLLSYAILFTVCCVIVNR
nr:uncharacterized protein LOC110374971 [Helicoverpa armigera]